MAKITFRGMDAYMRQLTNLRANTDDIAKKAVYEGAKTIADGVRTSIDGIDPNSLGKATAYELKKRERQIEGLKESFGVSPMENDNGYINVKLGFDGYNDIETIKYPNGQPNPMIARVFNSGTSFSNKTSFMDKAVRAKRKEAEKKIEGIVKTEIQKIMKE